MKYLIMSIRQQLCLKAFFSRVDITFSILDEKKNCVAED